MNEAFFEHNLSSLTSLYRTWHSVLRVDSAAGGEGDGRRVVLFVLLPPAVEEQQHQQQHHQDDQHHDAADGSPGLLLAGRQRNHDAARPLGRVWGIRWGGKSRRNENRQTWPKGKVNVAAARKRKKRFQLFFFVGKKKLFGVSTLFTVICSALTHTLPSKSVTDEVGWTRAGLSAERAEASWTAGWKTQEQKDPCIRRSAATLVQRFALVFSCLILSVENNWAEYLASKYTTATTN